MKYIIQLTLVAIFYFVGNSLYAQRTSKDDIQQLKQYEDSLKILADSTIRAELPDERMGYCNKFIKELKNALNIDGSYNYSFDSLATRIHIIQSPDKRFKIFNWVVATAPSSKYYFGAIQLADGSILPLYDKSNSIEDTQLEKMIGDSKNWFGCEYYNIIEDNTAMGKHYLLFGFNSGSFNSNRKLIDVLSLSEEGIVSFGKPIFADEFGNLKSRFVMEYKKGVSTTLNYDNQYKMIMYTRLGSEINAPSRKDTYIPIGPIDGLRKDGGVWRYVKEAIPVLKLDDGQAPIDGVLKN